MQIFSEIETMGHEQIIYCNDVKAGLKAIIAIHDTTLGPALGGTRLLPYAKEDDALKDVLRLSRGMTYKAACAGLSLGGGKAVIIASPEQKSESLMRSFGRFVNSLQGRYITAEDMNINVTDMDQVRLETRYVTGVSEAFGGSGNPSPMTALGIFSGIRASLEYRLGIKDLRGVKISIEGVGSVGKNLCKLLAKEGAELFVSDISEENLNEMKTLYGAKIVPPQELYKLDVQVYAPCARGATLNDTTIPQLKAKVVAGCANNQLEDEVKHARMLQDLKILYAPDYVINAGGLINVSNEIIGYNESKALLEVTNIGNTLRAIFLDADRLSITTHEASNRFAEKRIENMKTIKNLKSLSSSALGQFLQD